MPSRANLLGVIDCNHMLAYYSAPYKNLAHNNMMTNYTFSSMSVFVDSLGIQQQLLRWRETLNFVLQVKTVKILIADIHVLCDANYPN